MNFSKLIRETLVNYPKDKNDFSNEFFQKGEPLDNKLKIAISVGKKGIPVHTKQSKKRLSEIAKKRKWSNDTKKKIGNSMAKKIHLITTPQNKKIIIQNLNEFARIHKLDQGNLTRVAQGKLKQHKGYKVSYK